MVSVEYFPGHFFLTAQNHGTEYSLSRSLPRPSHFIVRDNDQLRLLLSSVDSSSLPSALVQTMLLINSFTITQRKLCKLLAFTCAVSLAVSLRRVLLRGIFLIRVVSVEYFPGHFFLTAQNHGTEYSLSRSLPRPSHFIVRDNDQLRLLLSSVDSSSLPSALQICSTNDAAHKFVHDHPQKALQASSVYVRSSTRDKSLQRKTQRGSADFARGYRKAGGYHGSRKE